MDSHTPKTPDATTEPTDAPSEQPEASGISRREFVVAAGATAAVLAATPAHARTSSASRVFRIHPAIGIARLGNADPSTFFIGPEAPGYGPLGDAPGTAAPPYKASDGRVKPQGVRFRIFEYATVSGRLVPVQEVTLGSGIAAITWSVHLANKKASFYGFDGPAGEGTPPVALRNAAVSDRRSLEIDFGARTISGANAAPVDFRPGGSGDPSQESCPLDANGAPVIPYLGQLQTDAAGRLIVLGGSGRSAYSTATAPDLASYANNDGWFDDASDGPVTAVVTTVDDKGVRRDVPVDAHGGAWVLCTPPDFAPRIRGAVTGYDLLFDLAVRSIAIPTENGLYDDGGPLARLRQIKQDFSPGGSPSDLPTTLADFTEEIQPILLTGYNYWWVDGLVTYKHNSLIDPNLGNPDPQYDKDRQGVLIYLRPPLGVTLKGTTGNRTMPHLLGDNPYIGSLPDPVRRLAFTHVQYALLTNWANGSFTPPTGAPPPPTITAHGLDRAALENCSGGAFYPGIELGWQARNPALYAEPFRLNLAATSGYYGEEGVPIGPGHFTRQMALPWQADFNDCRNEGDFGWWPSQRPTDVLPSASATQRVDWARPTVKFDSGKQVSQHSDMVQVWWKFGFVVQQDSLFLETERAPQIP
jgi:hypothetical protein